MNYFSEEQLLQVVAERVRKYTSNESTSVTYRIARQLMSSIIYCMKEVVGDEVAAAKDEEGKQVIFDKNMSAMEAFQIGLNRKKQKIEKTKQLYETIMKSFCSYHNDCYQDTIIDGMKVFFERYDVEFDATNHLLTLDYPLMWEVKHLQGIDLIYEYLYRSALEQSFLKRFEEEAIAVLLLSYQQDYSELIINVAKIVLRNVAGCLLAGKSIQDISIGAEDRDEIIRLYRSKTLEEIELIIDQAIDRLIQEEYEGDILLTDYLKHVVNELAYELKHGMDHHCLEQILIEVKDFEIVQTKVFEEGSSMEDEALRQLIEDMKNQSMEDRIELLKNKVRSLADLKEILLECFYQEECESVFELLSSEERKVLLEEIELKIGFDEELYEWEERLIRY
jgi:hypothetical protein